MHIPDLRTCMEYDLYEFDITSWILLWRYFFDYCLNWFKSISPSTSDHVSINVCFDSNYYKPNLNNYYKPNVNNLKTKCKQPNSYVHLTTFLVEFFTTFQIFVWCLTCVNSHMHIDFWMNCLPHNWHLNGVLPAWILICIF